MLKNYVISSDNYTIKLFFDSKCCTYVLVKVFTDCHSNCNDETVEYRKVTISEAIRLTHEAKNNNKTVEISELDKGIKLSHASKAFHSDFMDLWKKYSELTGENNHNQFSIFHDAVSDGVMRVFFTGLKMYLSQNFKSIKKILINQKRQKEDKEIAN